MGKCAGLSVRSESRWSCWSDRSTICAESLQMGTVFPLPLLRLDSNMSLPTSWCTIVHPRTWLFQPAVRVPLANPVAGPRSTRSEQKENMLASPNGRGPEACDRNHGGDPGQPAIANGRRLIWRAARESEHRKADFRFDSMGGEDHAED